MPGGACGYGAPLYTGDLIKQVRTLPGRPADGVARWFYESFVPGEDCCELGLRRRYSLRSTFSLGGMHRAAKLDRTSQISDGFQRRPQTISSPPPQRKVVAGTKDSARGIGPVRRPRPPAPSAGPVRRPAAADCLTR
ncbi:hypothetical protein DW877_07680 [[Clostridium] symbiosum]|nr:hypothetical protein DW877_07680 [[Clostridium] symbiosum]